MKKVALFLLLLSGFIIAENLHWMGNYKRALQKAKIVEKPLLILLVNRDKNSTAILKTCFSKDSVIKEVNSKTVPVIVLFEGKNSYPIEMYYTTVFPTIFVVNPKDESLLHKPLYGKDITVDSILKLF